MTRLRLDRSPKPPLGLPEGSVRAVIALILVPTVCGMAMDDRHILRYGGRHGFGKSIPFFLGLIMGQFVIGSLWNLYGIATDTPTYQFWE